MTDKKISQLLARPIIAPTDELTTLAAGTNYRSPVASLINLLGGSGGGDGAVPGTVGINGIALLRGLQVVVGQTIYLNYHTSPGDYGGGWFAGKKGANMLWWQGDHYYDDDGTVVVPPGGPNDVAWFRIWDNVKAHVGWFGAKCTPGDLASDDYLPVKKCFDVFTSGRSTGGGHGGGTVSTGIIDVGPGFCFSQPLIYGGSLAGSIKLVGMHSMSRGGQEKSLLRYTGPETHASIIFYGANEWVIEDVNTYPNLALAGILITADNAYNNSFTHTTTAAISAGSNVVVSPAGGSTPAERVMYLQPGVFLGVGGKSDYMPAAGADFEIVYITKVDTVAGTFTADFKKDHPTGTLLGGGTPCSSGWVNRSRIMTTGSPIWTALSTPAVNLGPGPSGQNRFRYPVPDMTGIKVGHPVRVGSLVYAEIIYPDTVAAGYFEGYGNYNHVAGSLVMYPTSGIAFGNRLLGTVQVDNVTFNDVAWTGTVIRPHPVNGEYTGSGYAGFRQIWGGNVKAFMFNNQFPAYLRVAFACEQASGQYHFNGGTSAGLFECIWWNICATLNVLGWEDESSCIWLTGLGGSSPSQANLIGCTFQGGSPMGLMVEATNEEMIQFAGQLTMIGCYLINNHVPGVSIPIIVNPAGQVAPGDVSSNPGGITLINNSIINVTLANFTQLIRLSPGDATDRITPGDGNITMINNIGSQVPNNARLPNIIPPQKMWQRVDAGHNPPSLAANTVGPLQTLAVPGAALGDLVDASFSLDLQGVDLNAWVSAANTVKFQFRNFTAGLIDLAPGDVKVRVRK